MTAGYYTFDPFTSPVYVVSVTPVTVTEYGITVTRDEVVTADAGTFHIAPGTFEYFAKAA